MSPVFTINFYVRYVVVRVHPSWADFQDYFKQQVFLFPNSGFRKVLLILSLISFICFVPMDAGREEAVAGFY